jgi:hypothetical protein
MAKELELIFQFPPIHGSYDEGYGRAYIFGEMHEDEIEDLIHHESLHYVIEKVAGKRASLKLDRIYNELQY